MVLGLIGLGGKSSSSVTASQKKTGFGSPATDTTALVTGSSGLCGARLVEMLLERGTQTVVAFDLAPPDADLSARFAQVQAKTGGKIVVKSGKEEGDLTSSAAVEAAFQSVEQVNIVYHIAALVGPFYDREKYFDVNLEGTKRIIDMCKKYKVPKLVYASSPGTRFTGEDIDGLREDQIPIPKKWLATYAETKYYGEVEVHKACCDDLLTISVAPHQVYGPHDKLSMPKLMETSGNGRLRIFGKGGWRISMCYVDNYAHGLMCGADALYKDSPALAKFYIITDGPPVVYWDVLSEASIVMGFQDLRNKAHLPLWLLYMAATVANIVGALIGKKFKLNYFTLRMMSMHRYFDISNSKKDLGYEPLRSFEDAWPETLKWFKENWLPTFLAEKKKSKKRD